MLVIHQTTMVEVGGGGGGGGCGGCGDCQCLCFWLEADGQRTTVILTMHVLE
jgi:hypothetical protein